MAGVADMDNYTITNLYGLRSNLQSFFQMCPSIFTAVISKVQFVLLQHALYKRVHTDSTYDISGHLRSTEQRLTKQVKHQK